MFFVLKLNMKYEILDSIGAYLYLLFHFFIRACVIFHDEEEVFGRTPR